MSSSIQCVVAGQDLLGEGPLWVKAEGRLYWFDILGARLSWFEPQSGARGSFPLPMRASAAAPCESGGLIAATEQGLAAIDTASGNVTLIKRYRFPKGFRTNDGKIDPKGRFWWSLMDDDGGKRPGRVYVTLAGGQTRRALDGVSIANTLTSSADGATLYLADSARQTITAYDVDAKTAALSRPRPFADTRGLPATPDGSAMDIDGFLWNAQWDGARLVRYNPKGAIDRIVAMPVTRPTSCAFGGPDLATLYVTSSRADLTAAQLRDQPLAGGLFALDPGITGLALPTFRR